MRSQQEIQARIDELKNNVDLLGVYHPQSKRLLCEIAALEWALGGNGMIGALR